MSEDRVIKESCLQKALIAAIFLKGVTSYKLLFLKENFFLLQILIWFCQAILKKESRNCKTEKEVLAYCFTVFTSRFFSAVQIFLLCTQILLIALLINDSQAGGQVSKFQSSKTQFYALPFRF